MITILGGIFAASLGANLLLKEERDRTAEFLLAQPLSRLQVWAGKTAAAYVYVVAFNAVTFAVSAAAITGFSPDPVDVGALLIYNVYVLLLTVLLASLGLLLSAAVRRGRSMTGVAVAIAETRRLLRGRHLQDHRDGAADRLPEPLPVPGHLDPGPRLRADGRAARLLPARNGLAADRLGTPVPAQGHRGLTSPAEGATT